MHRGKHAWLRNPLPAACADMLTNGFEWTMRYGKPETRFKYRSPEIAPCCQIKWKKNVSDVHSTS